MTLPKLPLADCGHFRYQGDRYDCALGGTCEPAEHGRAMARCTRGYVQVKRRDKAEKLPTHKDKPVTSIAQTIEAKKNCVPCQTKPDVAPRVRSSTPPPSAAKSYQRNMIPPPPTLILSPQWKRAVVTVAVGDEAKRCLNTTRRYMQLYAARLEADYVELDWPGHPSWPMSSKYAIPMVLDHYERIVYFDADILLRPGCVDLFAMCNEDELGMVDQLPHHTHNMRPFIDAYQAMRRTLGFSGIAPFYFNAGVIVASREHKQYLMPPTKIPMPFYHCAEQDHTNAVVLEGMQSGALKVRLLDRRCNWQNWHDNGFRLAPPDAVLHWSGSGFDNRTKRAGEIAKWATRYPLPAVDVEKKWSPPASLYPAPHQYYADARHVRMIRDELATRNHRRVLEIGCFHGYSSCAFLEAMADGDVDEVHLCDVNVRDELKRSIQHYGVSDKVTSHSCSSLILLERERFDLVFVDGDHGEPTVSKEATLLLRAVTPTVFAHDTGFAAHTKYGTMRGPAILAKMFRSDTRYACYEDCEARPGERTDRGLFLARLKRPDVKRHVPTLSIIIATLGRDTLAKTIASLTGQLKHGDEVIIERDNTDDMAATPRTRGAAAATGDYLLFIDDDDVYRPEALGLVRTAVVEHPDRVHLFALEGGTGWRLPQFGRDVCVENVSTQMIVVPNDPTRFGHWGPRRRGDFDFIQSTILNWGDPPVWHQRSLAVWRP